MVVQQELKYNDNGSRTRTVITYDTGTTLEAEGF